MVPLTLWTKLLLRSSDFRQRDAFGERMSGTSVALSSTFPWDNDISWWAMGHTETEDLKMPTERGRAVSGVPML